MGLTCGLWSLVCGPKGGPMSRALERPRGLSRASTLISAIHTIVVIVVGFVSVIAEFCALERWRIAEIRTFLTQPTTALQRSLFCCSIGYYAIDCLILLEMMRRYVAAAVRTGKGTLQALKGSWSAARDVGFLCHHMACLWGLAGAVFYGMDGTLLLIGFSVGELSNPPRVVATLVGLFPSTLGWLKPRVPGLTFVHFLLFVGTRVLLAKYAVSIVAPLCALYSTMWSAAAILIIGFVATVIVTKERSTGAFVV